VKSVLADSSAEKSELGRLINKISSFTGPSDYSPAMIRQMQPIQRTIILDMFRDLDLRLRTQYDISQSIMLLGSSMSNVFGGELQKIEKDISYMDSYINNYSFISGEDDLYNSSFIENFDNEQNSYINENQNIIIPDRDGSSFIGTQLAHVDNATGTLKYSQNYNFLLTNITNNEIKSITYDTNFSKQFISSDTGVERIFNSVNSQCWSLTAKSPFVIKTSIFDQPEYSDYRNGVEVPASAQVAVKVEFNRLLPLARLRISPNYTKGLLVAQIVVETEDTRNSTRSSKVLSKKALLDATYSLEKDDDIDFDQTYQVKSIIVIFSQTNYVRTKISPVQSESSSKLISEIVSEIRKSRSDKHDTLQDYVIKFFLKDTEKSYILRNQKVYNYNYTSYYPDSLSKKNFGVIEKLSKDEYYSDLDSFNKFKNTSLLSNMIFSVVSYTIGSRLRNQLASTYIESNARDATKSVQSMLSSGLSPIGDSNIVDKNLHFFEQNFAAFDKSDAENILNSVETTNMYEYNFSFKNFGMFTLGTSNPSTASKTKSFFVSRKIDTKGRPIKVKMLTDYFSEIANKSSQPNNDKTSIEFSVSVVDNPIIESDWKPIIPYGDSSIRSEKIFPNSNGECVLRFDPDLTSIYLYENAVTKINGVTALNGRNIKINSFNPNNTYFVSYIPRNVDLYKEVDLHARGVATPMLISPNYNGSNGEYFSSTSAGNRVRLSNDPYVDHTKFINATYSPILGTTTTSSAAINNHDYSNYSPVKILMSDGNAAINLSNYLIDNFSIEQFYTSDLVLFIHSGDSIIFNKQIKTPFRVLYQYVPKSFRYRVIMRSLTSDPQNYSVDRLIFKFSSEKRDSLLINLIKYDNLFKNKIN
jgi:hypothetical protein